MSISRMKRLFKDLGKRAAGRTAVALKNGRAMKSMMVHT